MVRIFVEGKNDKWLIQAYINHLYSGIEIAEYEIIGLGGWQAIKKMDIKFLENTDDGGKNLVIFDADGPENGGGKERREAEILQIKADLEIEFDLFLFPNNSEDGDIETLLEMIINGEHASILKCFQKYLDCISDYVNEDGSPRYSLPGRKAKMYAYIEAFPSIKKVENNNFFFENATYWNLDSNALDPLKNFLDSHLKIVPEAEPFSI